MNKLFRLEENGTNVRTEVIAGLTTFFTMAYIVFVNPGILSATGMDKGAVMVATILAAAIATFIMAFLANVPYAQAPGMGLNAFFTYTVCLAMKIPWQQALAIVFICGVINIIITATRIRRTIIASVPESLQLAITGGIGLFIAYIGFMNGHMLGFVPDNQPHKIIPSLATFSSVDSLLTLIGLILTIALILLKVKGAILIGIIAATFIGIPLGVTHVPTLNAADFLPPSIAPTFFKLDFAGLFGNGNNLFRIIMLIISFSLADTFDTVGTFLGTGRKSGIFTQKDEEALKTGKGFSTRMERALFADATATSIGALLGTSNTTTYIESTSGISEGGRTGLTSVVTGLCFLAMLFIAPIVGMVPEAATAPALIVIGIMMMEPIARIKWSSFDVAIAAFFTVIVMPFTYSIANGVAAGFIFYILVKLIKKEANKVHPLMYVITALFMLKFIVDALHLM